MSKKNKDKGREILLKAIELAETDFEKQLTYISAGALALSMTFIEKFVSVANATGKCILVAGWILLILTLAINLVSHLISKFFIRKTIKDYDNNLSDINTLIESRNSIIEGLNWLSVIILITGISLVVSFSIVNI